MFFAFNILEWIQQADSVARSTGSSRHFADIYSKVMKKIETQIKNSDSSSRQFVIKFENSFAEAKDWQIALLGVNAHANRDLWQVLVTNFRETDIRQYKKQLRRRVLHFF